MIWIQTAALCLWLLNLVLLLSGSVWAWWWVRKAPPVDLIDQPPVSILKPLKGVDPGLESSLESFLNLEYPKYEVIFSIADARDPAVKVVTELLSRYPNAPARLIIGEEIVGANPKVNNLIRPLDMASYDQILISDSYIRASPDYIQHLLQPSRPNVGVVTGLRRGREGQGLGGRLEELHINCFYIRWQLLAQLFRMDFVIGSSMLFRKSFADKFGGLRALADHGSEDYAFGLATKRHGKKVGMTRTPVTQYIGEKSLELDNNKLKDKLESDCNIFKAKIKTFEEKLGNYEIACNQKDKEITQLTKTHSNFNLPKPKVNFCLFLNEK